MTIINKMLLSRYEFCLVAFSFFFLVWSREFGIYVYYVSTCIIIYSTSFTLMVTLITVEIITISASSSICDVKTKDLTHELKVLRTF